MTDSLFEVNQQPPQELPTPPLRLRRARLHGVGPDGARFDPLDLDFSTSAGAAARVLLSLTNTGGKSTLITLICSLIVPAARAQVGGKILGDYVLTGDTSHIVCEWEDAATGYRTVTGTVMEWKDGRRQPAHKMRSTSNMHRAWYMFRTGPDMPGIDDLPFIADGRRVTFRHFRAAIDNLIDATPAAHGILVDKQTEWTSTLEKHTSIDPVLFAYQMRMNDSETGAEQLLHSFDSPDNVVRFFVTALNDQRDLEIFAGKLGDYAVLAAQRSSLAERANFGEVVVPLIERVAVLAEERATAEGELLRAFTLGGEHVSSLINRIEQDRRNLTGLADAVTATSLAFATARRDYGQVSDVRLQLVLEQARAAVGSAAQRLEVSKERANLAEIAAKAWRAVNDVLALRVARAAADTARQAYEKADADLGPLRADVAHAAAALAGRLDGLITESGTAVKNADDRAADAVALKEQADEKKTAALVAIEKLSDERARVRADVEAARLARTDAVTAGWLHELESLADCVRRWRETQTSAEQAAETARTRGESAEQRFDELDRAIEQLNASMNGLREQRQSTATDVKRFVDDFAVATGDSVVLELAGGEVTDTETLLRTAHLAAESARDADARSTEHGSEAKAAYHQLGLLDLTGTAPAAQDVLDVLDTLSAAGIGSVTGLQWIENNIVDADAREPFIAANPELAGGVVVSDRNRFDDGVRVLQDSELPTRTPVTVTTPPTTLPPLTPPMSFCHVVIPHRSTWDRVWAAELRQELEVSAQHHDEQARQATEAAQQYRASEARCRDFARRWGATTLGNLEAAAQDAAEALATANAKLEGLSQEQTGQRTLAGDARIEERKQTVLATNAKERTRLAVELADQSALADQAETSILGIDGKLNQAKTARDQAIASIEDAEGVFKAATQQAANYRSDCESHRRERADLGVDISGTDPGGNPAILRTQWTTLREELAKAEHGMVEATRFEDANKAVSRALAEVNRLDPDIHSRAESLCDTIEASTDITRADAQRRSQSEFDAAHLAHLEVPEVLRTVAQSRIWVTERSCCGTEEVASVQ
ncbi:hypothetical protein ACFXK0_28835, partial [Nocardia sp. NPDC059177]|uniref:hypothetical protein n=1 Tax=Nocardia sp. NPDC059177 TaxID=3346759 RepID=UPI00367DAA37